jgi:glucose-1-phosphate thymidylyltransferase
VKALILAAGYATRLSPLTDDFPKQLLPVGGRPIVDWIVENTRRAGVEEIHLVTNARFAPRFTEWAAGNGVIVHDDGTSTNDTRLGAIGDIDFVGLDDDLLVIAGDNLFEFHLADFVAFWRSKGTASAVAVRDVGSLELASRFGVVDLAADGRMRSFVEKPADPQSSLAATATYAYHRDHVRLVRPYLEAEHGSDEPGRFLGWLQRHEPVYGWVFHESWHDIGNYEQLLEADNELRSAAGLPPRSVYSPD